jgi:hypothetical protein
MKPRAILSALFCLVLGYSLFSCHKSEVKPSLALSSTSLFLDSTIGAVDTFSIHSNVSWKITVSPAAATSWLQLSQTSGNGNAVIKLTITGQNSTVTQLVTLTLEAAGNANVPPQTITLAQKGSIQTDSTTATLAGAPSVDTISIITGLAWKATPSAPWIHVDTVQGAGSYKLKISADTNRTGADQKGTVTLASLNNPTLGAVTINVTQKAYYAILSFSPTSGKVGATVTLNGYFPDNFTVTMNASSPATIVSHTATQIVCTLPTDATGGYFFVNIPGVLPPPVSKQQFTITYGSDWKKLSDNSPGFATNAQNSVIYTYNGNLYFGFGNTGDHRFYRLDTTSYQWKLAFYIPNTVQVWQIPLYFIVNNKLYVGGGYDPTALAWYEYDMTQDGSSPSAWRQLTSMPEAMLYGTAFAVGGTGYISPGLFTPAGNNLLYKFTTTGPTDPGTWTSLGPLNVQDGPAAAFVIGNTVYTGGGTDATLSSDMSQTFFTLNPPSTTLTQIAKCPTTNGTPGQRFSTWTVGNMAYLYDQMSRSLLSYDPTSNNWTTISTIPNNITTRLEYAALFNGHTLVWSDTGSFYEYAP